MTRLMRLMRSRRLRRSLPGILSTLLVLIVAACSNGITPTHGAVLTVATAPAFPPFEFKSEDGTLQGFDIDLMNAIARHQDRAVEFVPMSFDDVIRSLIAGNTDAAISSISITADRANRVSFSRPYFEAGLAIAIPQSTTDIATATDLENKRLGVQARTTGEAYANTIARARLHRFERIGDAFAKLEARQLDAVINDRPVTQYLIQQEAVSNIQLVDETLTQEYYGIAVPRNSPLLEEINAGLTAVMDSSEYAEIYNTWFNQAPPSLPKGVPGL